MIKRLDVTFNGNSLSEKFGIGLLSYKKQSSPSRKTRGLDIPGRDGSYKINSAYSTESIELSVVVEAATPEKVHKKIRTFLSWLSQQDEPKVVFTDDPDVFVRADLDTASEYYVTRGSDNAMTYLTIDLYQYDPFTYDNGVTSYSFEANPNEVYDISNEGMHTPYIIKVSGTENASTQYMATSVGHNTLEDSAVASNIIVDVNGIQQKFLGTITSEDMLIIDSKELTVKKNGESVITNWEGDMEDLVYGENKLSISNTEGIVLSVTIEFYRRWL